MAERVSKRVDQKERNSVHLARGITALVVVSLFIFGGVFWLADGDTRLMDRASGYFGYERTRKIAMVPCLGCMALNPVVTSNFTDATADDRSHPKFVLDELEYKPVFLHFRTDACPSCDRSEPFIDILEDEYKDRVTFIHINLDHTDEIRVVAGQVDRLDMSYNDAYGAYKVYNKFNSEGVPMFVLVTQVEYHTGEGTALEVLFKPYLGEIMDSNLDAFRDDLDYAVDNYILEL